MDQNLEQNINKILIRLKKTKKVYFILEAILFSITLINFGIALILGEKYDILFIAPMILSFILLVIFLTYYQIISAQDTSWMSLDLSYLSIKFKIIFILVVLVFGGLALSSFILSMINGGSAATIDGEYVIVNHGRIVNTITADEYTYLNFFNRCAGLLFVPFIFIFILFLKYYDDEETIRNRLHKNVK